MILIACNGRRKKNYIMNTFHNGLRRIQTDSKTAQQYVLLCLALAVAALIMVSGGSGEDVISVVFRPFVNFIRVIAWLAECLASFTSLVISPTVGHITTIFRVLVSATRRMKHHC